MERYNLFLDDFRNPDDGSMLYCRECVDYPEMKWEIARNYDEFKTLIDEKGIPDFISYDHDLYDEHYDVSMWYGLDQYNKVAQGFKHPTGLECTQYLLDKLGNQYHPPYRAHTRNPAGKTRIDSLISMHNLEVAFNTI